MEKIKIHETEYEIISIMPVATNVLQIEFVDTVPEKWGDVTTYTVGGSGEQMGLGREQECQSDENL